MAERASKEKRLELAYTALLGGDEQAAMHALERIEQHGDASAIAHLLKALAANPSAAVAQRITSLLNQVKASGALPALMAAVDDPRLRPVRSNVLAALWNAGLDCRDQLERLVDIAIEGDAQECFECLTIIEHQEVWPEKAARRAMNRLRDAAASEYSEQKRAMLNGAWESLRSRFSSEAD